MNRSDMSYRFMFKDVIKDYNSLWCMQIVLHEEEPTVNGIHCMLHDLQMQRFYKPPEFLLMNPQDLKDMSRKFVDEHVNRNFNRAFIKHYFIGKLAEREMYPAFYGRDIKRFEDTLVYPLEILEHRVVMVGFMPVVENEVRINYGLE